MDVRFVNAFVGSIVQVFKTMMKTTVTVGKPVLKQDRLVSSDVSAVIEMSGDAQGCVALSFPADVACKAVSRFAGAELTVEHPDLTDAVGELANLVADTARKEFADCNVTVAPARVIVGAGHQVSRTQASPFLLFSCQTELGAFNVEIALVNLKSSAGAARRASAGAEA